MLRISLAIVYVNIFPTWSNCQLFSIWRPIVVRLLGGLANGFVDKLGGNIPVYNIVHIFQRLCRIV